VIVVDTSALMAILQEEPEAYDCVSSLIENHGLISAVTMAEALIVAMGRNVEGDMQRLLDNLEMEVVDVTHTVTKQVVQAYRAWGKGRHPAALNFVDCFAYQLASERNLPLLYIGQDFARTDIGSAL
jgi:ribonuclease VapC